MSSKPEPLTESTYSPEHRNEETKTLTKLQKARFMLQRKVMEKYAIKPKQEDIQPPVG